MIVLIVDDERVVAESMGAIFRTHGHTSFCATDPSEAFRLAREIHPQLLITDVVMPGQTGIELAIKVQREFPECKVLLMSGQAETTNLLEEAEQQGYRFEIFAKPLWPPDLLKKAIALVGEDHTEASKAAS